MAFLCRQSLIQRVLHHLPAQVLCTGSKIDGCRAYVTVPHHARQAVDVAAPLEHQCCERMPQLMDGKVNFRGATRLQYQVLKAGIGKSRIAVERGEEFRAGLVQTPALRQVPLENVG